jgi:hypothetical protein
MFKMTINFQALREHLFAVYAVVLPPNFCTVLQNQLEQHEKLAKTATYLSGTSRHAYRGGEVPYILSLRIASSAPGLHSKRSIRPGHLDDQSWKFW